MSKNKSPLCPNGHAMDPNWDKCPYCEAQERSNRKNSVAEGKPTIVLEPAGNDEYVERRTVVGGMPQSIVERKTVILSHEALSGESLTSHNNDDRRIVGALVTYSWLRGGQLYPLREGRNFIGSGSAGSGRACDVQVPQDEKMSSAHALILCRSGKFEIIDQQSSNGTILNGEMLLSNQSVELDNNAEIKTGSTSWTFVKIEPPSTL